MTANILTFPNVQQPPNGDGFKEAVALVLLIMAGLKVLFLVVGP